MKLNLKQTQALDYLEDYHTTEVLFGGGAGGGKSILGCYFLMKFALKYPESRWVMGRASMKTLKETTYVSFLKTAKIQGLKIDRDFQITSPQHKDFANSIVFPNGSAILMKDLQYYPSDPDYDELGSLEITGGFIDEANQVTAKAKNILASRMRHNISEYGILPKLLMTCNPAKNWTYQDFYRPHKDGKLPEHRKFVQSLVTDNPDIDPTYYQNLLKLDEISKQRLLYGNWEFDDDPATLIIYEKILDIFTNDFVSPGEKYITADIARYGSDTTVIAVWDGLRCELYQYKGKGVTEVAQIIKGLQAEFSVPLNNIICDDDGVGGGVVDILRCKGFVNNSTPLPNPVKPNVNLAGNKVPDNYTNLKSQCYFLLAEKINANEIYVNCNSINTREFLIQELEQVKQHKMDQDGKKQVVPKDKVKELIGRSPDFSDALMMRMWFSLKPVKKLVWA